MKIGVHSADYFTTRIWTFDLSDLIKGFKSWDKEIQLAYKNSPLTQGRSNRNGWNSETNLFTNKAFRSLEEACGKCFIHCLNEMGIETKTLPFGLNAWINITFPGGYNVQHGHPGAYLSGCFYLETPENSGRISFSDPRLGAVYSPGNAKGILGSSSVKIQPKQGQLLIFPSWLEHSVEQNLSKKNRISIAMNAVPTKIFE